MTKPRRVRKSTPAELKDHLRGPESNLGLGWPTRGANPHKFEQGRAQDRDNRYNPDGSPRMLDFEDE